MYDYAGEWLLRVGLLAKSGVAGGPASRSPSVIVQETVSLVGRVSPDSSVATIDHHSRVLFRISGSGGPDRGIAPGNVHCQTP